MSWPEGREHLQRLATDGKYEIKRNKKKKKKKIGVLSFPCVKRLLGKGAKHGCLGYGIHCERENKCYEEDRGGLGFPYHSFILWRAHFSFLPCPYPHTRPRPHLSFLSSSIHPPSSILNHMAHHS